MPFCRNSWLFLSSRKWHFGKSCPLMDSQKSPPRSPQQGQRRWRLAHCPCPRLPCCHLASPRSAAPRDPGASQAWLPSSATSRFRPASFPGYPPWVLCWGGGQRVACRRTRPGQPISLGTFSSQLGCFLTFCSPSCVCNGAGRQRSASPGARSVPGLFKCSACKDSFCPHKSPEVGAPGKGGGGTLVTGC